MHHVFVQKLTGDLCCLFCRAGSDNDYPASGHGEDAHVLQWQQVRQPTLLRGRPVCQGGRSRLLQGLDCQLCAAGTPDNAYVCLHGEHAPRHWHEGLVAPASAAAALA